MMGDFIAGMLTGTAIAGLAYIIFDRIVSSRVSLDKMREDIDKNRQWWDLLRVHIEEINEEIFELKKMVNKGDEQ